MGSALSLSQAFGHKKKMLGRLQQRNFNEYSSGLLKTALFLAALALLLSCYAFIFVAGAAEGHGDTY